MESFFLAETTKYLYLLFDPDHYLNNDGGIGTLINTPNGQCVIDAGGYIFNTEAHPIDPSALRCCYDMPRQQLEDYDRSKYLGDIVRFSLNTEVEEEEAKEMEINDEIDTFEILTSGENVSLESYISRLTNISAHNVNQLFNTEEAKSELLKFLNEMKSTPIKNITLGDDVDSVHDDLIIREHVNTRESANIAINRSENDEPDGPSLVGNVSQTSTATVTEIKHSSEVNSSDDGTKEASAAKQKAAEYFRIEPKKTTKREPFDAQRFLQRIRTLYDDKNVTRNYELLSCKAQSFSQRLAVLGEIIT